MSTQYDKIFYRSQNVLRMPQENHQSFRKIDTMKRMKQITENNSIHREARFVLLMLHLLGVSPLQTSPTTGEIEMKIFSPIMLYSATVVGLVTAGTLFMMHDRYSRMMQESSSFGDRMLETACIIFFIPVILVPFTHWYECGKKAGFINGWKKMQIEFQKVAGKQLKLDLTKATRKVQLSVALNVSVLTTLLFVMQRGFTWWQGLCFAYCVCLSVITTGSWGTMGKGLQLMAQSIMTELQLCVQTRMYHCPDTVRQFNSLWLQLNDLTQKFGNALGFSRACHLLVFFVQDVLAVYVLTSNMEHAFDSVNLTFGVSAFMFTYGIFVICDGGQLATDQVGRAFQINLQKLCDAFPQGWNETRYEITLLLQMIRSNPPKIKLCGFVEVNRGLMASLLSAMMTYLVVLIQFQMSWQQLCPADRTTNHSAVLKTGANSDQNHIERIKY